MLVSDILQTKGHRVETVTPETLLVDLSIKLNAAKVGAMIVSSDGKQLNGIISERDVVRAFAENGAAVTTMKVRNNCTLVVHTCAPNDSIASVARLMTNKRIRHVPVVNDGQLVGIVSIGDVLKYRLDEMQLEANVLRDVAIAAR